MVPHSSVTASEETPHAIETTQTTISDGLRRRAQSVIYDTSIDPEWRAIIRYALETNDPWLADLVHRADAGETVIDMIDFSQVPTIQDPGRNMTDDEKIEALTEIICRTGDEPEMKSAALLVLMATLETTAHPKTLANTVKYLASKPMMAEQGIAPTQ